MPTSEINTCWGLVLCGLSLTPALHCHAAIATWEKHMLLKTETRKKTLQTFPEVKTHSVPCVLLVPDMKQFSAYLTDLPFLIAWRTLKHKQSH